MMMNRFYEADSIETVDTQPLTNTYNEPISDGQIPQSTDGITSGTYDALNPSGHIDIVFTKGNYQYLQNLSLDLGKKTQVVTNMVVPLIEKALIELLGASSMYTRDTFQSTVSFENNQISISALAVYSVPLWIGLDVPQEDIKADAEYVFNTLNVLQGLSIGKCQLDTTDGLLTIQFAI